MSIRSHSAEELLGDVGQIDRGVDFGDVSAEFGTFETNEMIHVNMRDEKHGASVIVAFEGIDGNERVFLQYAMICTHDRLLRLA